MLGACARREDVRRGEADQGMCYFGWGRVDGLSAFIHPVVVLASRAPLTTLLLCSISLACSERAPGADADAATARFPMLDGGLLPAVEIAQLPDFGECADGWSPVDVGEALRPCHPTRGLAPTACPPGRAWFVGGSGCVPVGRPCPPGAFADDLPATGVIYVAPGGAGDGRRDAPMGSVQAALDRASIGQTVALGKGQYAEGVRLAAGVALRGACAGETRLTGSVGGAVVHGADGAAIEGVTLSPERPAVGIVARGGALHLAGVVVDGAAGYGFAQTAGDVVARELLVRRTQPAPDGTLGACMTIGGGRLMLSRAVTEGCRLFSLGTNGDAVVTVEDFASRTLGDSSEDSVGLALIATGTFTGRRIEVSGARAAGVSVLGAGVQAELSDVSIHATRPSAATENGPALSVADGALLRLSRAWLDDSVGFGIAVADSVLEARDVVVSSTAPNRSGVGIGLFVRSAASATVERLAVQTGAVVGALVTTTSRADTPTISGTDLTIDGIVDDGASAAGFVLLDDASADLSRVSVSRVSGAGVLTGDTTFLRIQGLRVIDGVALAGSGELGRGLEVSGDAIVEIQDALFERNREASVVFFGGRGTFANLRVKSSLGRECAPMGCPPGGHGLSVQGTGDVHIDGFAIEDAALCGVFLAPSGELDLANGTIAGAGTGACVQIEGYDLARLTNGVTFGGPGISIDSTDFVIPEPAPLPLLP